MAFGRMLAADGSPANLLIRLLVGGVFFLEGIKTFLFPNQWGVGRFIHIGIPLMGLIFLLVAGAGCFSVDARLQSRRQG